MKKQAKNPAATDKIIEAKLKIKKIKCPHFKMFVMLSVEDFELPALSKSFDCTADKKESQVQRRD